MKVQYLQQPDVLHIDLRVAEAMETRRLDDAVLLKLDGQGRLCGMVIERAAFAAAMPNFSYEWLAAES